jgi:signal peptidase
MTRDVVAPLWRRGLSAVWCGALIAAIVFLWPARLGGSTNMVVVRGTSMEPLYHLNDIVVAREAGSYAVGDVVLFSIPSGVGKGMLVIHRLVGIRDDGSWITQGDNRDTADRFELHDADLKGTPQLLLPKAGRLLALLSNVYVIALTIDLLVMVLLWPRLRSGSAVPRKPSTRRPAEPAPATPRLPQLSTELAGRVADQDVAAQAEAWLAEELARLEILV